jgi:hypothetical protein
MARVENGRPTSEARRVAGEARHERPAGRLVIAAVALAETASFTPKGAARSLERLAAAGYLRVGPGPDGRALALAWRPG